MPVRTTTLSALAVTALTIAALTGCAEEDLALGGGSSSETTEEAAVEEADVVEGDDKGSPVEQATADGLPSLPITECPQGTGYEYSSESGRSVWHLVYTCTDRTAYDATGASLVAEGYESSPTVISESDPISERNHLLADANGGSTQVQLNLVGSDGELEFEIYVTIDLP